MVGGDGISEEDADVLLLHIKQGDLKGVILIIMIFVCFDPYF